MAPHVTIVRSYDWTGMYIDGKLAAEGHTLPPELVARALGAEIDGSMDSADVDRLLDDHGSYPATLEALKAGKWDDPGPNQRILHP